MLDSYVPEPTFPAWRNVLFPLFVRDQFKVVVIIFLLVCAISVAVRDINLFFFLLAFGYVGYAWSMQAFLPYKLHISEGDLETVSSMLDKTPVIARHDDELRWKRKTRLMPSQLDEIFVVKAPVGLEVHGRKTDMKILATALNKKAR
jgi:hypothetical protein